MRTGGAPFLAAIAAVALASSPAHAVFGPDEVQIAARALSFLQNPPEGAVRVGIVYDPNDAQSVGEADALRRSLEHDPKTGNLALQPLLLQPQDAAGARVGLFLLTDGAGAAASRLGEAARAKRIPCVTGDFAQVRSGACAIGVQSNPRVEILVNRSAAEASGVVFSTVFRMLITEY